MGPWCAWLACVCFIIESCVCDAASLWLNNGEGRATLKGGGDRMGVGCITQKAHSVAGAMGSRSDITMGS